MDAADPSALASFWSAAIRHPILHEGPEETFLALSVQPPVFLVFVPVAEPKAQKNRIHLDLASESDGHQVKTVDRLLVEGARRIDIGQPATARHVVLADPEGNEFCVTAPSESSASTGPIGAIAFDAAETALGHFWSEATGWPVAYERDPYIGLRSPDGSGPIITFGPPVAAKQAKNRWHLDVAPPIGGDLKAEVERLTALGASRIDIGQGDVPWVVLSDPEGNEFCALTPR